MKPAELACVDPKPRPEVANDDCNEAANDEDHDRQVQHQYEVRESLVHGQFFKCKG